MVRKTGEFQTTPLCCLNVTIDYTDKGSGDLNSYGYKYPRTSAGEGSFCHASMICKNYTLSCDEVGEKRLITTSCCISLFKAAA